MNRVLDPMTRMASVWALLVAAALLLAPQAARAQSEDIDWADAGAPSQGTLPSPTTVTGSDGTTATVSRTITTSGASTFTSPFASDFLSYFSGQIGGGTNGQSPILINLDNSEFDPLDRVTIDIVLSRAVTDLNFELSDIDNGGFVDAVEVFYDDDLTGGFTNAANNTALWSIGSSVARTNDGTLNGWIGDDPSDQFTTDGDVALDFNGTQVRRIRIVYFSYTGTGNPGAQFASISDLRYAADGADLSLTKTLVGLAPFPGGNATWRLTVTNASSSADTANGIIVEDTLPSQFSFSNASGTGSFNSSNGQWSVGSLAPGASASIDITGTVSSAAGTVVTNVAEIIASSESDPDSTVNNGATTEDDYATSTFTVQNGRLAGIPPILVCPAGQSVFDWDAISSWTDGSTDNTYAFASFGNVRFELDNDGAYIDNATFGGQSPTVFNAFTGGLDPAENSLTVLANQANQTGEVEVTITLPRSFTGLQFTIFDVDFNSGQFSDRVEVVGTSGGTTVLPTLTNGNVNFVVGNEAFGDGGSNNDQDFGNVVVTFDQAVDTVVVRYGNHSTAPDNPGQQGIGIHDITVCDPFAQLSVTKVSSVIADPVNGTTNAKAIPGATIEYLITVTNIGTDPADADTVVIWDDGPADAKMCLLDRSGGPVIFANSSGTSGLTYDYGGAGSPPLDLGVTTDDLEFSEDDAVTFDYTPTADDDNCDDAITDFRVRPGGAFAGGTSVTLRVRYQVE